MKNREILIPRIPRRRPHTQLKTIRKRIGITQEQAAELLGVSYPYLLSVEIGQRELSRPLADRITRTFGVAQIENKNEEPLIRRPNGDLVPFTKELYEQYRSREPSYFIEGSGRVVRPTAAQYGQCVQALLEATRDRGTIGPLLADFFAWFATGIQTDEAYASFKQKYEQLFGKHSYAFRALTDDCADRLNRLAREKSEHLAKWIEADRKRSNRAI